MRKTLIIVAIVIVCVAGILSIAATRPRGILFGNYLQIYGWGKVDGLLTVGDAATDTLSITGKTRFGATKPLIVSIDTNNTKQLLVMVGGKLFAITATDTSRP